MDREKLIGLAMSVKKTGDFSARYLADEVLEMLNSHPLTREGCEKSLKEGGWGVYIDSFNKHRVSKVECVDIFDFDFEIELTEDKIVFDAEATQFPSIPYSLLTKEIFLALTGVPYA